MLTQIYEVSNPGDAAAISSIGIDHVGVLVGAGEFPREQTIEAAEKIAAAIRPPSKFSALFLTHNTSHIEVWVRKLRAHIVHLGAASDLLLPSEVARLKDNFPSALIMRSVPVSGEESIELAKIYDGIADFLLLDSYRPLDRQIGALGTTHDWSISRRIVELVRVPVILAGGLGPENVANAMRRVRPAGVDSKTKTDRQGSHAKDLDRVRRFHQAARAAWDSFGAAARGLE